MGCGDGEDGDMVLMIDSVVMWMMVEGGVARLELASAAIFVKIGVLQIGIKSHGYREQVMSSPTYPTPSDVDEECTFPSANILGYTSTLPNYFPATPGNISSDFLENSKNDEIPPVFLPFYNNPYLKNTQAFYAKESPIPPPGPITPPAILTPSSVLLPSLLFDPRYFFVPEELLPLKKKIHPPSSSSTTLSNLSRKQACILVPPSFSTYAPTPPQIYELGKSSIKMHVEHHEKQIESILNYLEELSFHYIKKIEERLVADGYANNEGKEILEDNTGGSFMRMVLRHGKFMPPKPDLSFSGIEEFVNEPIVSEPIVKKSVVETSEAKTSADKPKAVKKNNGALIIKDWVLISEAKPINKNTTFKNSNFNQRVNTVKDKNVNAARPKAVVNTARPKAVVNDVQGNHVNAVKASACWVWKPKTKVIDHVSKHNSASTILKRFDYIDAQGKSKHMTENMSYLTDFEKIDGGYVAFGGNPKGGKITDREADMNNLDAFMPVSPIPTTRVHKDHPVEQIIGDLNSAPQTRRMIKGKFGRNLALTYTVGKVNAARTNTAAGEFHHSSSKPNTRQPTDADTHNLVAFLAKPAKSEGFEKIVDFLNAHTIKYALKVNPTIYTYVQIEQFSGLLHGENVNGEYNYCLNEFVTLWLLPIMADTNQKFNFSKYIFESMVKNLENVSGKFLMYSRVGKGFSGRDTPLFLTMMVQAQQEQGEGSAVPTDPHHTPTIIQPSNISTVN
ncbi:hypothetical protein Tco_1004343 [Tanacetum coccineum]|uniref:Uncharacterized protein n=1 Tax=Tanacetum coccineum TaxID=301880 RepID=A0ABQ5FCZ4_9ASTR